MYIFAVGDGLVAWVVGVQTSHIAVADVRSVVGGLTVSRSHCGTESV